MMTGILLWKEKTPGLGRNVTLEEMRVLHLRLLCARVARETHPASAVLRRRVLAAGKKLHRAGVTELILPEDLPDRALPDHLGLGRVSTVPLRQLIAADWVRLELEKRGISPAGARVAVTADRLTGEVVHTVTELVLRHRYVLLDVPQGTDEFRRHLRREYGVSLLDGTDVHQLEQAEARVIFNEADVSAAENPVVLHLRDESAPLPTLLLPPGLEQQLPSGVDRGALLALLLRAGALRPGQLAIASDGI